MTTVIAIIPLDTYCVLLKRHAGPPSNTMAWNVETAVAVCLWCDECGFRISCKSKNFWIGHEITSVRAGCRSSPIGFVRVERLCFHEVRV